MSRRINLASGIATLVALLSLLAVPLLAAACTPMHRPVDLVDLSTVAPCPAEDGPGPDGPAPCVWDADTRGCSDAELVSRSVAHQRVCPSASPRTGPRWIWYTETCTDPLPVVQDPADVDCVGRWDWSGGTSGKP